MYREFDKEGMLAKFAELRDKYVLTYEPDFTVEDEVRYAKGPIWDGLDELYSRFLIPHIREKKYLFTKEHKSLPKNAVVEEYEKIYHDAEGKLHHTVYEMGALGFLVSEFYDAKSHFIASFYVSEQLRIDYNVLRLTNGELSPVWNQFEWCEYDEDGRLTAVESYRRNGAIQDGVIINAEYYEYEDGVLSHAYRFHEFDTQPLPGMLGLVRQMMPDRILNPECFEYDFSRDENGVTCNYTHFFRKSQTINRTDLIPMDKALKLKEHGIPIL